MRASRAASTCGKRTIFMRASCGARMVRRDLSRRELRSAGRAAKFKNLLLALPPALGQNHSPSDLFGASFSKHHFDLRGQQMKVVFSRRVNEGLVIGGDMFVTVLQIRKDHVRLAIACPRLTPSYW